MHFLRLGLPLVILFIAAGCSSTSHVTPGGILRQAVDVPDHFLVGSHSDTTTSVPRPGEGCRNPMMDPRDGTRLILVRSSEGLGDYEAPEGRYGVGGGELLRLDCGTGVARGIVRR